MANKVRNLLIIATPLFLFAFSNAAFAFSKGRILFLLPLSTKSHQIFFQPLIDSLADMGYDITVLTNERTQKQILRPSVKELLPITSTELMKGFPEPFKSRRNGSSTLTFPFQFIVDGCHKVIQSETFGEVMNSSKKFDLIIVDAFVSNCLDGFIYKSETPFILVTTMPAPSYVAERVGNFLPPSIIPVLSFRGYSELDGHMGFFSRLSNFFHFVGARIYVNFVLLPRLEKVYRTYLGDETPSIPEIESSAAMIFMNSHFSMNFPRPLLPTVIEVGGMHCREPKQLANLELRKFISKSEAPYGFIYFSAGSIVDMNNAPNDFVQVLMTTFSKLKQRVLIKWSKGLNSKRNSSDPYPVPKNVYVGNWFSQQDILGHENIRLFISHGGLLSMQEAVWHAVPVLGVPFGVDQDTNVHNAVLQGHALQLDVNNLSEENLNASIHQLINNPRFLKNAQRISKVFRSRPVTPLQNAIFWVEYVLESYRDNATTYIQSAARKMTIFQYYSCDILAFLGAIIVPPCWILYILAKRLLLLTRVSPAKQRMLTPEFKTIENKID